MNTSNDFIPENKNLNFVGFFVQIVGLMFLGAWIFNAAIIRKVDPAAISMNPLTAVNFILIGTLILLKNLELKQGLKKSLQLLITMAILVPVVLTLSDFLFKTSLNADRFFTDTRETTYKMSLASCVTFFLIGIALLLSNFSIKTSKTVSQYFVAGSLYISLICLFGYLYNIGSVAGLPALAPMPLHTSILLVVVSIVLLLQSSNEGFIQPVFSTKVGGQTAAGILKSLVLIPFAVGIVYFGLRGYGNLNIGFYTAIFAITSLFIATIVVLRFSRILNEMDGQKDESENKLITNSHSIERYECLISEMGSMSKAGIWEVYVSGDTPSYWSEEIYAIYKLSTKGLMTFETTLRYYKADSKKILMEHHQKALTAGTPYDLELKLLTSNTKEIWVRVAGKPIFDKQGAIIGVRGILQDIDDQKRRELLLQISIELIEDQNKRLLGFSHIVSHNLLTHSETLVKTIDQLEKEKSEEKVAGLIDNIRETGESINIAIEHLNEVVRIETNIDHTQSKSEIKFEDTLKQVTDAFKPQINSSDLTINSDFSECETIHYLPQYLESILLNFTHNTIKYKEEGKPAVVNIKTNLVNNKTILTFSDNTMGIDLNKERGKVLEMYKSFQDHANAKGTWLFLAKSQVESLGGNLEIQSTANEGTAFKITL